MKIAIVSHIKDVAVMPANLLDPRVFFFFFFKGKKVGEQFMECS